MRIERSTKIRILSVVALSLCLAQGAEARKEATIKEKNNCRATCDANAKKCALDGKVNVAACIAIKDQCYKDICAVLTTAE